MARYEFAADFVSEGAKVLDLACGVGYGSYILATTTKCQRVLAIDISKEAIEYARQYYSSPKITYCQGDCLSIALEVATFDIVVSFETIEHIQQPGLLLSRFFTVLKPGGKLILSTPNELAMPFKRRKYPFHVRHYTPEEITGLVRGAGFSIEKVFSQSSKLLFVPTSGWGGGYIILVCLKAPSEA